MKDNSIVSVQIENYVANVVMSNGSLNLWSGQFVNEFESVLNTIDASDARAVVITSAGEHFSAGGDFNRFAKISDSSEAYYYVEQIQGLTSHLAAVRIPVIAAVKGVALGGGLELALACDIRVASENARFGLPESRWGLLPAAGGTQRLTQLLGPGAAKLLMYSGQPIDAHEAHDLGLVEVIVSDDPYPQAARIASDIALNSPRSVEAIKLCVDEGGTMHFSDALRYERETFAGLASHGDLYEGVSAFLEKREPQFLADM